MAIVVQQGAQAQPAPGLTVLNELLEEIRAELIEPSEEIWTDAELSEYLNDGYAAINRSLQWWEDFVNLPVTSGIDNPTEEPAAEILRITRVTWDGEFMPQSSEFELDRYSTNWRAALPSIPQRWYYKDDMPVPENIRLYPKPNVSTDDFTFNQNNGIVVRVVEDGVAWTFNQNNGIIVRIVDTTDQQFYFRTDDFDELRGLTVDINEDNNALGIWFVREINEILQDEDRPSLPVWTYPIAVYYALYRAYDRNGPFKDEQLAQSYLEEFVEWVRALIRIRNRQFPDRVFSLNAIKMGDVLPPRLSRIEKPSYVR